VARTFDAIYLDVDMLASWIPFLLLSLGIQNIWEKYFPSILFFAFGLWVGLQSYMQSQIVISLVLGMGLFVSLFFLPRQSVFAGIGYALGFSSFGLLPLLEFKNHFLQDFTSTRSFTCMATNGLVWRDILANAWAGHYKNSEFETLFSIGQIPIFFYLAFQKKQNRNILILLGLLCLWIWLGLPQFFCNLPGLNSIKYFRYLLGYIQPLGFALSCYGLWLASRQYQKYSKWILISGVLFAIYPSVDHTWINQRFLAGDFAPQPSSSLLNLPQGTGFLEIQKISQTQDRRHFSPDDRLYPNFSHAYKILDLRMLYGIYPKYTFSLNEGVFKDWNFNKSFVI
jgi:hypothetical protein